ncbi:MAG: HAD family phosphatase [Spirochaetota bacterium]
MKRFSAIISDFDGTLVNSEPCHIHAWEKTIRDTGVTEEVDYAAFIGVPDADEARELIERFSLPFTVDAFLDRHRRDLALFYEKIVPFPRVIDTLSRLESMGIPVACASNSERSFVADVARRTGIDPFVTFYVTGDDVKALKPAPDIYQRACEMLSLPPVRCIAVEDSIAGIIAAKAAGVYTCAVATNLPRAMLSGADIIIDSFDDVLSVLGST